MQNVGRLDFPAHIYDNQYMTDAGQVLIIAAISIMTIILTILGIQLILILRDFQKMMNRFNTVAMTIEKFGMNITSGTTELMGFVSGMKNVLTAVDFITDRHKKNGSKK